MALSKDFIWLSAEFYVAILGEATAMTPYLKPMDYFDIHTHRIPFHPSQAIVSIDASALPLDDKVVYASIGIHPWHLTETNAENLWEALKTSVTDQRIIAIGEAGLDKLRGASMSLQTAVFQQEIALSESFSLPMVIHCVRAFNELIQIRKSSKAKEPWIIHGFRGKPSVAQELLKHGCRISFGSHYQEESVKVTPLDCLFVETDESAESIEHIYLRIAQSKGISPEELAEAINKNVREVFFKS